MVASPRPLIHWTLTRIFKQDYVWRDIKAGPLPNSAFVFFQTILVLVHNIGLNPHQLSRHFWVSSHAPAAAVSPPRQVSFHNAQEHLSPAGAHLASKRHAVGPLQHSLHLRLGLLNALVLYTFPDTRMSASPTAKAIRHAAPAPHKSPTSYAVSPLLLPTGSQHLQDEIRRPSIQFLAHRNTSLPRGNPKPREKRRLSSPPPPP